MLGGAGHRGRRDFVRPFRVAELRARVAAHLRQAPRRTGCSAAAWLFDLTARSAAVEGTVLPLTRSEYAICEHLALHAGQTLPRSKFTKRFWH